MIAGRRFPPAGGWDSTPEVSCHLVSKIISFDHTKQICGSALPRGFLARIALLDMAQAWLKPADITEKFSDSLLVTAQQSKSPT